MDFLTKELITSDAFQVGIEVVRAEAVLPIEIVGDGRDLGGKGEDVYIVRVS